MKILRKEKFGFEVIILMKSIIYFIKKLSNTFLHLKNVFLTFTFFFKLKILRREKFGFEVIILMKPIEYFVKNYHMFKKNLKLKILRKSCDFETLTFLKLLILEILKRFSRLFKILKLTDIFAIFF